MADLRVQGHAVVFNSRSEDLGGFVEIILPGAFADSLKSGETVFMLRSHDQARPVASTRSGTLGLREDETGLHFTARLADVGDGAELGELVKRGVLTQMSFGFVIENARDEKFERVGNQLVRFVRRARLLEISPVTFPAFRATTISARSLNDDLAERQQALKRAQERDLKRRRLATAQAAVRAAQRPPEPPPEPVEAIRARARRKRIEHARRFGETI